MAGRKLFASMIDLRPLAGCELVRYVTCRRITITLNLRPLAGCELVRTPSGFF